MRDPEEIVVQEAMDHFDRLGWDTAQVEVRNVRKCTALSMPDVYDVDYTYKGATQGSIRVQNDPCYVSKKAREAVIKEAEKCTVWGYSVKGATDFNVRYVANGRYNVSFVMPTVEGLPDGTRAGLDVVLDFDPNEKEQAYDTIW